MDVMLSGVIAANGVCLVLVRRYRDLLASRFSGRIIYRPFDWGCSRFRVLL